MNFITSKSNNATHYLSTELLLCGLGYRAEFVIKTVREIVEQKTDMVKLAEMDYDKAKQEI